MSTYVIIGIVFIVLIGYIIYTFNQKETKKVNINEHQEFPPKILISSTYNDQVLYPETSEMRKELFKKAFTTYKINNREKFEGLTQSIERREIEINATQQKKVEAFMMVKEQEAKKNTRLQNFGKAMSNLANITGNSDSDEDQ
jgi:excinuclease UvrABC ATPase subunit